MRNIYSGCVQTKLISKISWNVNTLLNLHFSDIVSLVVLTLHCHELEILKISLYFQGSYNEDNSCVVTASELALVSFLLLSVFSLFQTVDGWS